MLTDDPADSSHSVDVVVHICTDGDGDILTAN